jgi:serine/threonine protein kinase
MIGYKLVRVLAAAESMEVWEAELAGRKVALKLLGPNAAPERRERFLREARVMAACAHPGILACHHVFPVKENLCIAMELARGPSLAEQLTAPHPPREGAQIVEAIARATAHIHSKGLTHRAICLHNIYYSQDGTVKLGGFSSARAFDDDSAASLTDMVRVDLRGLGSVLHELLAGPDHRAAIPSASSETPLSPRIPGELVYVCQKCLGNDPAWCYRAAGELADELTSLLRTMSG